MILLKGPVVTGKTEDEKISQIISYLFELVGDLNHEMQTIAESNTLVVEKSGTANDIAAGVSQKTTRATTTLNMNGNRITGVPEPQSPSDAVSVEYVQKLINKKV